MYRKFFGGKEKEERTKLHRIADWATDPIVAVIVSVITSLILIGFTSGQIVVEYNNILEETVEEITELNLMLERIEEKIENSREIDKELDKEISTLKFRIEALEKRTEELRN